MEQYIIVHDWNKHQHYKDQMRPAWIKCFTKLLHKDEYLELSLSQRGLLHGIWLLYAQSGGELRVRQARRLLVGSESDARRFTSNLESLRNAGFIHFYSRPVLEQRREEKIYKEQPKTKNLSSELQDAARSSATPTRLLQAVTEGWGSP